MVLKEHFAERSAAVTCYRCPLGIHLLDLLRFVNGPSQFCGLVGQYLPQPISYRLVHALLCRSSAILLHENMDETSYGLDSILPLFEYAHFIEHTRFS